ncbi:MAG: HNH endonuclease [Chloroflexi bacterium]|nr:HNH endonuclease [Chloroflexota bacterium]
MTQFRSARNRVPMGASHVVKARLIARARQKCEGCGWAPSRWIHPHQLARADGVFELDHKIPLARGGDNGMANLQVLCLPCHDGKSKGNLTDAEWRYRGCPQDWARKNSIIAQRER